MRSVVTISRQIGSQGDEVAERLAAKLNMLYFDKKLLGDQARKLGISIYEAEACAISEDDYRVKGVIDTILGNQRLVTVVERTQSKSGPVQTTKTIDDQTCMSIEETIIRELAKAGNIVIVGRGGQALLKGDPSALHVKIVSPFEDRVQRIMKIMSMKQDEVEKIVKYRDTATREYLKQYYSTDWDDDQNYDTVINMEKMSVSEAVSSIAAIARPD